MLRRERWRINQKKTRWVYRELGLQLPNKTPKRRVKAKLREDRRDATRPNETWAMDFVHDQLATGRKIRVLTVVDTFSRYAPEIDPLSLLKTPKCRESLAITVPPPYRHRHVCHFFRIGFPVLFSLPQPRFART
jgi:putative transposase